MNQQQWLDLKNRAINILTMFLLSIIQELPIYSEEWILEMEADS